MVVSPRTIDYAYLCANLTFRLMETEGRLSQPRGGRMDQTEPNIPLVSPPRPFQIKFGWAAGELAIAGYIGLTMAFML